MLNKKEILINLMEEGRAKACTIIGEPTEELRDVYFNRQDLIEYITSKKIEVNIFKYERTDLGIYFPQLGNKTIKDCCAITFTRALSKKELDIVCSLFKEIYNYYQTNIPAKLINKIYGLYQNEPFTINDLFWLIKNNQTEIANKIGKSKQLVSDIKNERCRPTIEILSALKREYPLLPYDTYLRDLE